MSLTEPWQTLLSGAVGAGMSLFATEALPYYARWKRLQNLSRVFPVSMRQRKLLVKCSMLRTSGGTNPETYRAYVHSAEVLALRHIAAQVTPLGVELDLNSFYSDPTDGGNLLLIGSKAFVKAAEPILENLGRYKCIYKDGAHFYFQHGDHQYKCTHADDAGRDNSGRRVTSDYGIIVRQRVGNRTVLLVAGIHMHGTLAATDVALSKDFQEKVKQEGYDCFAQLVKVMVDPENGLANLTTGIAWTDYPLERLNPR